MADNPKGEVDDEENKPVGTRGQASGEHAPGRSIVESLEVAAEWRKKLGQTSTDSARALREDRDR